MSMKTSNTAATGESLITGKSLLRLFFFANDFNFQQQHVSGEICQEEQLRQTAAKCCRETSEWESFTVEAHFSLFACPLCSQWPY